MKIQSERLSFTSLPEPPAWPTAAWARTPRRARRCRTRPRSTPLTSTPLSSTRPRNTPPGSIRTGPEVADGAADRLRGLLASDVYTARGRLRSDDLLIRERVGRGLGEATARIRELETQLLRTPGSAQPAAGAAAARQQPPPDTNCTDSCGTCCSNDGFDGVLLPGELERLSGPELVSRLEAEGDLRLVRRAGEEIPQEQPRGTPGSGKER